jgi:hypothetical protein
MLIKSLHVCPLVAQFPSLACALGGMRGASVMPVDRRQTSDTVNHAQIDLCSLNVLPPRFSLDHRFKITWNLKSSDKKWGFLMPQTH